MTPMLKKPKSKIESFPEMEVQGKTKDHPSIADYYFAAALGEKPITYQHGLSNFSSVQLGDDRVSFKKSLAHDAYCLDSDFADTLTSTILAPKEKTLKQRKQDYDEAKDIVGSQRISEMEQMMRDKLQQRTKTGPFQLRKTFKYFDRDGSGGIDFSEFQRAMELMGFQFSDIQQLALFARYDESCTGEVDYHDFVENLMESDFKKENNSFLNRMTQNLFSSDPNQGTNEEEEESESDEEERETFLRTELGKIFRNIDRDGNGTLERAEIRELLKSLGRQPTADEFEEVFTKIDVDGSNHLDFDEFYQCFKGSC